MVKSTQKKDGDKKPDGGKHENPEASYISIFWTFFRIGLLTLGGGLAMATVMRHELVLKRKWIKDPDFMAEMSTATLVPGAIAVNMAYLQGRQLRGKKGAVAAVLGTILPSFSIILIVASFAMPYFEYPRIAAFFRGCAVAITGQLAFAGFAFGRKLLRKWSNYIAFSVGLFMVAVLKLHPVLAIITAGAAGYLLAQNSKASDVSENEY